MAALIRHLGNPHLPLHADPTAIILTAWYEALQSSLLQKRLSATRHDDGYTLVFQGQPEVRAFNNGAAEDKTGEELKAWVEFESRRCPFLTLEVNPLGAAYILVLTGPQGIADWLEKNCRLLE